MTTWRIHRLDSIELVLIEYNAFTTVQIILLDLRLHEERPRIRAHVLRGHFHGLVVFAVEPHVASLFGLVHEGEAVFYTLGLTVYRAKKHYKKNQKKIF